MLITLPIFALFTSIISAIIGMGGGILLLSLMTFFLPIQIVIPVHGLVQLVSNSSRAYFLKDHVKWKFFKFFIIGLPIGATISTILLAKIIDKQQIYLLLVVLISYVLFKPKKLPDLKIKAPWWLLVGLGTGMSAVLVGAVGPLIAPFSCEMIFKKKKSLVLRQ